MKIPLHHHIAGRSHDGRADDVQISMAEGMDSDSGDEVVLHGAIRQLDEGTPAQTRAHQWIPEPPAPGFPIGLNRGGGRRLLVWIRRSNAGELGLGLVDASDHSVDRRLDLRCRDGWMEPLDGGTCIHG